MTYANYEYYAKKYLGKLPQETFNALIVKASREIDKNVNTVITETIINNLNNEAQDRLKYTACALIDLISKKQEIDNKNISSYSIDGVSKTFKSISTEEYKILKKDILDFLPDELTRYI